MDNKYLIDESSVEGNVKISDQVIATIASVAAEKVDGVVKMQSNLKSQVSDIFSAKNLNKGAKVNLGEKEASVVEVNVHVSGIAVEKEEKLRA